MRKRLSQLNFDKGCFVSQRQHHPRAEKEVAFVQSQLVARICESLRLKSLYSLLLKGFEFLENEFAE